MRAMDCASELRAEWRALQKEWQECHEVWKDAVAERFEHDFLEPWGTLEVLAREMDRLEEALLRAEIHFMK